MPVFVSGVLFIVKISPLKRIEKLCLSRCNKGKKMKIPWDLSFQEYLETLIFEIRYKHFHVKAKSRNVNVIFFLNFSTLTIVLIVSQGRKCYMPPTLSAVWENRFFKKCCLEEMINFPQPGGDNKNLVKSSAWRETSVKMSILNFLTRKCVFQ